ncbi:MAG TPA: DUF2243 domain-containing protein [Chthoniobacterales bacterium]|jgi:uncharacterized membrane protein
MLIKTRPLTRAGIFLGIGLGGFFDGILFHQILQMHAMLSARIPKDSVPNISINMFWDGIFHAFTWVMTVIGVMLLFKAQSARHIVWSKRVFVGAMFLGWGMFNLVEGLVNHHFLHLHHVVESMGTSRYDIAFLASGVIFIIAGWLAIRSARESALRRSAL